MQHYTFLEVFHSPAQVNQSFVIIILRFPSFNFNSLPRFQNGEVGALRFQGTIKTLVIHFILSHFIFYFSWVLLIENSMH